MVRVEANSYLYVLHAWSPVDDAAHRRDLIRDADDAHSKYDEEYADYARAVRCVHAADDHRAHVDVRVYVRRDDLHVACARVVTSHEDRMRDWRHFENESPVEVVAAAIVVASVFRIRVHSRLVRRCRCSE